MENKNLVDILGFDNYKFDLDLNQVYSIRRNIYLKNHINHDGYYFVRLYKNSKAKKFYLNRLVYMCNNPTEDIISFEIDHIDNDITNNNIENLRKATRSENMSNKIKQKNNTTGYKNIHIHSNGYMFQLAKNKIKYTKYFKNLQDAIDYRDIKVKEICGEFANLG